jgi:hypothetical protein
MVAGLMPNSQSGGPGFSFRVASLSQKAPGTQHHPLCFAVSNDAMSRGYNMEVRVGFVGRADQIIVISWHLSVFTRVAYLDECYTRYF